MNEQEIKEELRYYSERYYAKPLTEAGFLNVRNDLLNWYRICSGVICHFHIVSMNSSFPMLMPVWWFHPTYLPAILNPPAAWNRFPSHMQFSEERALFETNTVELGHSMNVPALPRRGAECLEGQLFPQMRRLNTREAVYSARKERIFARWEESNAKRWEFPDDDTPLYVFITPDFADAALVMHDTEMFPHCIDCLEKNAIPASRRIPAKEDSIVYRGTELLEAQRKALKGCDVDQYFELMKERKAKFLKRYKLQDDFEL